MTCEIKALASRLSEVGCEMAAMESTGSYWKPLNNLFELPVLSHCSCNYYSPRATNKSLCIWYFGRSNRSIK